MRTRKKTAANKAAKTKANGGDAERPTVSAPMPRALPTASLNEATYNPRFISDEEMRSLKASITKHGMVEPLVVQKDGLTLIGGHQRLRAMRELAEEGRYVVPDKVPCVVLDVSDSQAKQLNISLNRIGGEFDAHKLGLVLADVLDGPDYDAAPLGFSQEQVDELVRQATATPEELADQLEKEAGEIDIFARSVTLTVPFETVDQRDDAKTKLEALAGRRGEKAGALLLRLVNQALAVRKPKGKGKTATA